MKVLRSMAVLAFLVLPLAAFRSRTRAQRK